jgi:hypothetical protein
MPPLDGRTPTSGGRPTYTPSTHKTVKKTGKEKKKKKSLKRGKHLDVLSYLLSLSFCLFFQSDFFSLLLVQLISTESRGRTSSEAGDGGTNPLTAGGDVG